MNIMLSLEQAKNYIEQCDFSNIINKLVYYHGWSTHEAEAVCKKYRRYLWLVKKHYHQYSLPPSQEIDEFWHHHILDTQRYHYDCELIFGEYLHHYPTSGIGVTSDVIAITNSYLKMEQLYVHEYGESIKVVRTTLSKIMTVLRKYYLQFRYYREMKELAT